MHINRKYHIFQVTDSKSHVLYNKDDAKKGKFAFTTEEYDMFEICFESKMVGGGSWLKFLINDLLF